MEVGLAVAAAVFEGYINKILSVLVLGDNNINKILSVLVDNNIKAINDCPENVVESIQNVEDIQTLNHGMKTLDHEFPGLAIQNKEEVIVPINYVTEFELMKKNAVTIQKFINDIQALNHGMEIVDQFTNEMRKVKSEAEAIMAEYSQTTENSHLAMGKMLKDLNEKIETKYITMNEILGFASQKREFELMKKNVVTIQKFISDIRTVNHGMKTIDHFTNEMRELMYEAEDIIADYSHAKTSTMAKKLKDLNDKIRAMQSRMDEFLGIAIDQTNERPIVTRRPCDPINDVTEIVGDGDVVRNIKGWIMKEDKERKGNYNFIGLVGKGGSGKTTLAQMLLKDKDIKEYFGLKMMFVTVSQPMDVKMMMKSMLKQLKVQTTDDDDEREMLEKICKYLEGRRYFVILDDVWSLDGGWWEIIKNTLPKGSQNCILFTSRMRNIVREMGSLDDQIHEPEVLGEEDGWTLFCKNISTYDIYENTDQLKEIGMEIVRKCGGLPLAIKVMAGVVSTYEISFHKWMEIRVNFDQYIDKNENDSEVMGSLELSYDDLPRCLQPCLLCFGVFPEDCVIKKETMIRWWIGEGFVPLTEDGRLSVESAERCFDELVNRSLIDVFQKDYNGKVYSCKVHYLVRKMLIKKGESEGFFGIGKNKISRRIVVPMNDDISTTIDQISSSNTKLRVVMSATILKNQIKVMEEIVDKIYDDCRYLRVLDLSEFCSDHVLSRIQTLKHLTYLNLWDNNASKVPAEICLLKSLLILCLKVMVDELPDSIAELTQLIWLDVSGCSRLKYLPEGLGNISTLQVLKGFKPSPCTDKGSSSTKKGCSFEELRKLTQLVTLEMEISKYEFSNSDLDSLSKHDGLRHLTIRCTGTPTSVVQKFEKLVLPNKLDEVNLLYYSEEESIQEMETLYDATSDAEKEAPSGHNANELVSRSDTLQEIETVNTAVSDVEKQTPSGHNTNESALRSDITQEMENTRLFKLIKENELELRFQKLQDKRKQNRCTKTTGFLRKRELIYELEDLTAYYSRMKKTIHLGMGKKLKDDDEIKKKMQSVMDKLENASPVNTAGDLKDKKTYPKLLGKLFVLFRKSKKIKKMQSRMEALLNREAIVPRRPCDPINNETKIVGVGDAVRKIKKWILNEDQTIRNVHYNCIGLVGKGGSGKTTLAQMVLKVQDIKEHFGSKTMFVTVSQPVDVKMMMQSMLKELKVWTNDGDDEARMSSKIYEYLKGRRYFVILDDVWSLDGCWWETIKNALPEGSENCVLVTSRNERIVQQMGVADERIHVPQPLEDEDGWTLFCKNISRDDVYENTELKEIGMEIVRKCDGLPLSIKVMGGFASSSDISPPVWMEIRDGFKQYISYNENYSIVMASLELSYDNLPDYLQPCLLCFGLFPEDYGIHRDRMIRWWIGEGFVPLTKDGRLSVELAEQCFDELVNRSLVEVVERDYKGKVLKCKVHDLVREMLIQKGKSEAFFEIGKDRISRRIVLNGEDISTAKNQISASEIIVRAIISIDRSGHVFTKEFLDKTFNDCEYLRVLDMSNMNSKFRDKRMFESIGNLKHLTYLYVSKDPFLFPKSLLVLCLSITDIQTLPDSITELKRLIWLDVSGCFDLKYLPKGLGNVSTLQILKGYVLPPPSIDKGCRFKELHKLTQLVTLEIILTYNGEFSDSELNVLSELDGLQHLTIKCRDSPDSKPMEKLDNLVLPAKLQELNLFWYPGKETPPWLNAEHLPSLRCLSLFGGLNLKCFHKNFYEKNCPIVHLKLHCLPELEGDWNVILEKLSYLKTLHSPDHSFIRLANYPTAQEFDEEDVWRRRRGEGAA